MAGLGLAEERQRYIYSGGHVERVIYLTVNVRRLSSDATASCANLTITSYYQCLHVVCAFNMTQKQILFALSAKKIMFFFGLCVAGYPFAH